MCIGRKLAKFKMLLICKKIIGIKLVHAHLQNVCIIPAKYQLNILKALGGVDFTKYAPLPISQYVHWTKIGYVQNAVNLSKKKKLHYTPSCTSTICL